MALGLSIACVVTGYLDYINISFYVSADAVVSRRVIVSRHCPPGACLTTLSRLACLTRIPGFTTDISIYLTTKTY
jgi:hypothetical protein